MSSPPLFFEMFADVPERAMAFYASLFSWSFERSASSSESWSTFLTAGSGAPAGRLLKRNGILVGSAKLQTYINACVLHLRVSDIESTLAQAARLGGVARPVQEVPGLEQRAYLMDTEGNMLCVVQPALMN